MELRPMPTQPMHLVKAHLLSLDKLPLQLQQQRPPRVQLIPSAQTQHLALPMAILLLRQVLEALVQDRLVLLARQELPAVKVQAMGLGLNSSLDVSIHWTRADNDADSAK